MQMELSHKRARVELERAASTSARSYEVGSGGPAPSKGVVHGACGTLGSKSPASRERRRSASRSQGQPSQATC